MEYKSKFNGEQADALLDLVDEFANGGGSSGGGDGNEVFNCEYFDITGESNKTGFIDCALLAKGPAMEMMVVGQISLVKLMGATIQYVAIALDSKIYATGMEVTVREFLNQNGITNDKLASIPQITKEEFYTI